MMRKIRTCAALAILAVMGCGRLEMGADSTHRSRSQRPAGSRAAGLHFAKQLLGQHLRASSTAKYPWESVRSETVVNNSTYLGCQVTGVVDAQNALGTPLREQWKVIVALDKQRDSWFPVYMSLSGKRIWGSGKAVEELLASGGD